MIDPTLYLVVNPEQCANRDAVATAVDAVRGGVTAVQIRCKNHTAKQLAALVAESVERLAEFNVPVIVNDDVSVAANSGAAGVHVGQQDTHVSQVREALGTDACVGVTVRSSEEVLNTPLDKVNYVSVGGVFPTVSKVSTEQPIGTEGLREIVQLVRKNAPELPVIAISGINANNLNAVLNTGVCGVAVVSAICESDSPEAAARQLKDQIEHYKFRKSA